MLNKTPRALFRIAVACCYLLFLLAATYYKARRPAYNWDMLPYMALVVSVEEKEPSAIHTITYNEAKRGLPGPAYEALKHSNNFYRDRALSEPDFFYQQLPFYIVKPFYVGLSFLLYKLGCSLVTAVFLPSVLSYFGIGLLIFFWLRRHLYIVMAAIVSGFIMLSAPLLYVSSGAVPDCLSAFVLLCSFYFLIEKKSLLWGYILLLLTIAVRIDNELVDLFVVSFLVFGKKWQRPLAWKHFLLMLGGVSIVYLAVASGAALYGWSPFFFPSFFVKHQEYFPQAS